MKRKTNAISEITGSETASNYYSYNGRVYFFNGSNYILISSAGKLFSNIFKNNVNYLNYLIENAKNNLDNANSRINIEEDVDYATN